MPESGLRAERSLRALTRRLLDNLGGMSVRLFRGTFPAQVLPLAAPGTPPGDRGLVYEDFLNLAVVGAIRAREALAYGGKPRYPG